MIPWKNLFLIGCGSSAISFSGFFRNTMMFHPNIYIHIYIYICVYCQDIVARITSNCENGKCNQNINK